MHPVLSSCILFKNYINITLLLLLIGIDDTMFKDGSLPVNYTVDEK